MRPLSAGSIAFTRIHAAVAIVIRTVAQLCAITPRATVTTFSTRSFDHERTFYLRLLRKHKPCPGRTVFALIALAATAAVASVLLCVAHCIPVRAPLAPVGAPTG